MKRFTAIVLLLVLTILAAPAPIATQADEAQAIKLDELKWEQLPDMPTGVLAAALSRVGDRVIITGGIPQLGTALNKAQIFDLKQMKWQMPVELVHGRIMHAQVTLGDSRILLAGGQTGTVKPLGEGLKATAECEIIDLKTGRSTKIDPLPRPVAEATGHLLPDGRAIIIGGQSALIFDPRTSKWNKGIGLREDRQAHASAVLADGRVVVVGGIGKASIEVIDPVAGASKRLGAELPHVLDDHRIVALPGNRVWILGGQHSSQGHTVEQTWILDLSNPAKSTIANGPKLDIEKGMADASIVQVGPWVLLVGGESQFAGGDIELHTARLLDTRTLKVHKLPDTAHPHDDAVAVATERGIIIFGGFVEKKMTLPFSGSKQFNVPQAVSAVEQLNIK